jgi:hypothetical protein
MMAQIGETREGDLFSDSGNSSEEREGARNYLCEYLYSM